MNFATYCFLALYLAHNMYRPLLKRIQEEEEEKHRNRVELLFVGINNVKRIEIRPGYFPTIGQSMSSC